MEPDEPFSAPADPDRLREALSIGERRGRLWAEEEMEGVWTHQLASPMGIELGGLPAGVARELPATAEGKGLILKSFGDLLRHPCPPVELLRMVKDFAKANVKSAEGLLPADVCSVLYYAAIAAALVRLDKRITRLSAGELRRGIRTALKKRWVDEGTKGLLSEAERLLGQAKT